ncbi:MAG: DUF1697 domain-containing protein [Gemmatimonadota bacterium]
MPRLAAFLRGINLGNRRLTMDELAATFVDFGVENVATYQAAGNVVFDAHAPDPAALEARIETHLASALGYPVDTFLRPLAGLASLPVLDGVEAARAEGFKPHVIFLKQPVDDDAAAALGALETPDDRFRALGREVLWLRRGRLSDGPISTDDVKRALGRRTTTMRTLGTVLRLVAKFG